MGNYPDMSLADAKIKHGDSMKLLRKGIDPAAAKQEKRINNITAPTISQLVDLYIEKYAKPKKRSWKEDERILQKDVVPTWGKRKAADIKRPDVIHLLESISDRGAGIQANRTLAVIRKMFNFAIGRGILDSSPCTLIAPIANENQKDRALSETEINSFWHELDSAAMADATKRILKLILVTAQRPGEVVGMEWSEMDGDWWTIPKEKAKNGFAHRVFLTPLAHKLLGPSGEGCVFPAQRGASSHIHINALAHAVRRNFKEDRKAFSIDFFTPHDLRRTAASKMTKTGIPRLVVSKILNHKDKGVTAVYDRHSYDKEKRQALEKWEMKLEEIITGKKAEKIVPLNKKTA